MASGHTCVPAAGCPAGSRSRAGAAPKVAPPQCQSRTYAEGGLDQALLSSCMPGVSTKSTCILCSMPSWSRAIAKGSREPVPSQCRSGILAAPVEAGREEPTWSRFVQD